MNNAQLQSIVRLILNWCSGAILAWTATKSTSAQSLGQFFSQMLTGPDFLAVAMTGVAWLWGHVVHSDPTGPAAPAKSAGGSAGLVGLWLMAGLWLGAAGFTAFALDGCKSSPPTVAYKALGTADVTVDSAMQAWGDYVRLNNPPLAEQQAVKAAFQKFQAAELVALDAVTVWASVATSTNSIAVSAASARSDQLAAVANNAFADLINLIQQYGVKL